MPRPMPVIDLGRLLGPNFRQRLASAQHPQIPGEPDPPRPSEEEPSNVARMPEGKSDDTSKSTDESAGDSKPKANNRRVTMSPLEAETAKLPGGNTNIQAMVNKNEASAESGGIHDTVPGQNESVAAATSNKAAGSRTEYQEKVSSKKRPSSTETAGKVPSKSKKQKAPSKRKPKGKKAPPNPQVTTTASEIVPSSLNRCVPLAVDSAEVLSALWGAENENASVPSLEELANFPQYCGMRKGKDGTKFCIMCGISRPYFETRKEGRETGKPFSVKASKGVCTSCEALVWKTNGIQVRFCNQCRNFCLLDDFVERRANKTNAFVGSCAPCRDRIAVLQKVKRENGPRRMTKREKAARISKGKRVTNPGDSISSMKAAVTDQSQQEEDSNVVREAKGTSSDAYQRMNKPAGDPKEASRRVTMFPLEFVGIKCSECKDSEGMMDMDESDSSLSSGGAQGRLAAGTRTVATSQDESAAFAATRKLVVEPEKEGSTIVTKRPVPTETIQSTPSTSKKQKCLEEHLSNECKEATSPGSTSSSQDGMTLAEMKSLVNRLDY